MEIDISAFGAGLYFIKVNSDNLTFTQRVEIQNYSLHEVVVVVFSERG